MINIISIFHNIHLGGTHSFFFLLLLKPPWILWSQNRGLNPIWLTMWQRLNFVGQNSCRKYQLIQKSLLMPFLQSCCFAILSLSTMCLWAFGKPPPIFPALAISAAFFALLTPLCSCHVLHEIRHQEKVEGTLELGCWGFNEGAVYKDVFKLKRHWQGLLKPVWAHQ